MIWMTLYFKEVVKQHNTEHWILNHSNVASDKHFNHFSSLDLIYLAWWYSSLKEVVQKRPGHISFNLGPYQRGSCIRYLGVVQVQIFGCWQLDKFCKQKYIHLIFRLIQCDSLHEQCWELLADGSWKKPSCTLSAMPSWTLRKSWKVKVGSRWSGNCCQKKEVWCDAEMSWCQIKVFSTSPQSACTRPSKLAKTKVNGLFSNLELN